MTAEDAKFIKDWCKRHPDELFPMSLTFLYPNSWRAIIELSEEQAERYKKKKSEVKNEYWAGVGYAKQKYFFYQTHSGINTQI